MTQDVQSQDGPAAAPPEVARRRFFGLGGTAAVAGLAGAFASAGPAAAAPPTDAWLAGGNNNINTDGTNFIGPTSSSSPAPLVFKTTPSGGSPVERMRIGPTGQVGVGMTAPKATLDVKGGPTTPGVIRGQNTGSGPGIVGIGAAGPGVTGTSTGGTGVAGASANGAGVTGTSTGGSGVSGTSTSGTGVSASGGYSGVTGTGGSYGGIFNGTSYGAYAYGGPYGIYASGSSYGLYAQGGSAGLYSTSNYGRGVDGHGAVGVYGSSNDPNGAGVQGDGGQYAVRGVNGRSAGVRGDSGYVGVWGQGPAYGVYGYADGSGGYAVMGQAGGSAAWGLYSIGNCGVQGTLTKNAGSFKIDHPLDPERKWLSHSFVESPDMMNVYNGTVHLGKDGTATIALPDYFETLNRDFRYQLTSIGRPNPNLHVKTEVSGNRFVIGGGEAGSTVSWQVTGIRRDDYAVAHPIVVEEDKRGEEVGARVFVPAGSSARPFHPRMTPQAGPVTDSHRPETPPPSAPGVPPDQQPGTLERTAPAGG